MIKNAEKLSYEEHPVNKGVFLKHFFTKCENNRLNNLEVKIRKDSQIEPHVHESSNEFFYVVSGRGLAFFNKEWIEVKQGDCLMAKIGEEHGFKNEEQDDLVLFSTFSPAIK